MDNIQISKEVRSAIKQGDSKRCFELLGNNQNLININTPFGTWLHVAASEGQVEIVKGLVKLGVDVNIRGGVYGGGPINEAASEGHIEVVDFLLSQGAEMDVSEPERNPLFGAISNGHVKVKEPFPLDVSKPIDYVRLHYFNKDDEFMLGSQIQSNLRDKPDWNRPTYLNIPNKKSLTALSLVVYDEFMDARLRSELRSCILHTTLQSKCFN
ncbi:ankyrin repeat domain-containing protein [Paenibacillus hexagrammi]|uniref:ankyrin repeat domain-containing protein n=1 Tax=Paenibacillus hexagrammi TaxID=2908839 RepID=UPI0038621A40